MSIAVARMYDSPKYRVEAMSPGHAPGDFTLGLSISRKSVQNGDILVAGIPIIVLAGSSIFLNEGDSLRKHLVGALPETEGGILLSPGDTVKTIENGTFIATADGLLVLAFLHSDLYKLRARKEIFKTKFQHGVGKWE